MKPSFLDSGANFGKFLLFFESVEIGIVLIWYITLSITMCICGADFAGKTKK